MDEKRCNELADMIDAMDDTDKKFILWKLISEYSDRCDRDSEHVADETLRKYIVQQGYWSKEIRDVLCLQIW